MAPKLVLYSDQIPPDTNALDERLFAMLPPKPSIGYLPSSPDPDRVWFGAQQKYYGRFGARLEFYGLETEFDPGRTDAPFASDAVHLTGGNTFQFLHWLRERDLMERLRDYARRGGALVGVSAGAILMTPDTSTSFLCGDEPYGPMEDLGGFSLLDFAVAPHYAGDDMPLVEFAAKFGGTVYALPDGSGIVVEGDSTEFFGNVRVVQGGRVIPIKA